MKLGQRVIVSRVAYCRGAFDHRGEGSLVDVRNGMERRDGGRWGMTLAESLSVCLVCGTCESSEMMACAEVGTRQIKPWFAYNLPDQVRLCETLCLSL